MIFINKKILIILLAAMLAGGLVGCDLLSSTTVSTTAEETTTMNLTTSSTSTTANLTTTSNIMTTTSVMTTTTAEPITTTTTTAVRNVAILLSGTWKTVYEAGSSFDPTGLVVTLLRSDASETIINEYFVLGFNSSVTGLQNVRVRYGGVESSFTVYVKEPVMIADITLELTLPTKLVYQPGQSADWTGLVVNVVRSDGGRIELDASTYEITGFDSASAGLVMITVAYDDLSASFPVYVADATSTGIALSLTAPTKTVYVEDDTLNLAGLVVTLTAPGGTPITLTSNQYTVTSPSMAYAGNFDVTVSTLGLEAYFAITINPGEPTGLDLIPYFDDAEGLEGAQLASALRTIISTGYVGYNYSGTTGTTTQIIIALSDKDPNRSGNYLIDIYTGKSLSSIWDSGVTWNKEHVWPQSLLGCSAGGINTCSDVHNLKPSSPSINSQRSNDWFANVPLHNATTLVDDDTYAAGSTYNYEDETNDIFEPRNEVKGDIARILFYMAIRYSMTLIELNPGQDPAVYQIGDLSTLLEWNISDPVDAFERNRNEVIYSYQHNRNPFIDHPELAELIW